MTQKKLVFLGGTCGNNNWREAFTAEVVSKGVPAEALFNPVVADWNDEAQANEDRAKVEATEIIFYLGDPKETENRISTYSIVEAIFALQDQPKRTVVVFDGEGMPKNQAKVLAKVEKDLRKRFPAGLIFSTPEKAVDWLAECYDKGL
jgi:Nucleoside 2-deoxyribosyltransferase like